MQTMVLRRPRLRRAFVTTMLAGSLLTLAPVSASVAHATTGDEFMTACDEYRYYANYYQHKANNARPGSVEQTHAQNLANEYRSLAAQHC